MNDITAANIAQQTSVYSWLDMIVNQYEIKKTEKLSSNMRLTDNSLNAVPHLSPIEDLSERLIDLFRIRRVK